MNYEETLDYLYNSAPLFQHIGKDAYKAGLENTYLLDEYFNHPHRQFRTIHIAGTNGKGSVCAYMSSISRHFTISRIQDRTLHFSTSDRFS